MAEANFTDKNFEEEVTKSTEPVLVDFWAPWCGPCKIMNPLIEELAQEYQGKGIKIGKLNVDENPGASAKYNVMSIPTLIIFKGEEILAQMTGAQSKDKLKQEIDKVIKK